MISVIIPAYNEKAYLNRTIDNFYKTARGDIEIVVVLNGYDQEVDKRAIVLRYRDNLGERVAMNTAAHIAQGDYLFRIDAHCDISEDWDLKMLEVFRNRPKAVAVAPLTALNKQWNKIPGHWYGFCNLLPTMEEKWNHDKNNAKEHELIEMNMAFTGCGFMLRKDFYWEAGGADESLPAMGAIGPEFALKGWLFGDGCYTRTDVLLGHIFDTGGYDTSGVVVARKKLQEKYGSRYAEIKQAIGDFEIMGTQLPAVTTDKTHRTVTINRKDEHIEKDSDGNILKKTVEYFKYVYTDDGNGPSEDEIKDKYESQAVKIGEEIYYPDHEGNLVKVA